MGARRGQTDQRRQEEKAEVAFPRARRLPSTIDINADLGEGFDPAHLEHDRALLDLVSSANIACGYHAGNADTIAATVRAASERNVAIGAHPSYPDLPGFGRRELNLSMGDIRFHVAAQLGIMSDICARVGSTLSYVKPHGALYNRAASDAGAAKAVVAAIADIDRSLILLGLAGSAMETAAKKADIRFAREAFVDRAYRADGTLVPRSEKGAVIDDPYRAVERAIELLAHGFLIADNGATLRIAAQSLCVHGDNPNAARLLTALRARLKTAGIAVRPFTS